MAWAFVSNDESPRCFFFDINVVSTIIQTCFCVHLDFLSVTLSLSFKRLKQRFVRYISTDITGLIKAKKA